MYGPDLDNYSYACLLLLQGQLLVERTDMCCCALQYLFYLDLIFPSSLWQIAGVLSTFCVQVFDDLTRQACVSAMQPHDTAKLPLTFVNCESFFCILACAQLNMFAPTLWKLSDTTYQDNYGNIEGVLSIDSLCIPELRAPAQPYRPSDVARLFGHTCRPRPFSLPAVNSKGLRSPELLTASRSCSSRQWSTHLLQNSFVLLKVH